MHGGQMKTTQSTKTKMVRTVLLLALTGCLQSTQPDNASATDLPDDQIYASGSQQLGVPTRNYDTLATTATPVAPQYFVDPLPIPQIATSKATTATGEPLYDMSISQFDQFLGYRDALGNKILTTVWGYNGTYPGPTIVATQNQPIAVDFTNNLPTNPLFPVDHALMGANNGEPDSRTITHHHGGNNAASDDGFPTDWNTPGQTRRHMFTNNQAEMTTWYHDHPAGITRYNVYAGLAGAYVVKPSTPQPGFRPDAAHNIPLIVQDKMFTAEGQLDYPGSETWSPELMGDRVLVNGMMYPYLAVETRMYRFQVVNGSNARFYNFQFLAGSNNKPIDFVVAGSDAGMLPKAKKMKALLVAPGERYEIYINFKNHNKEKFITLTNDAAAPYPAGLPVTPETSQVMRFNISPTTVKNNDPSSVDGDSMLDKVSTAATNQDIKAKLVRNVTLEEVLDATGAPIMLMLNGKHFNDPVTETPKAGSKEVWNFINLTADTHPMHLHAMRFRVISRRPFDVAAYTATKTITYIGGNIAPSVSETGWKDTVKAHPGQVTTIVAEFGPHTGDFVWHCHILEHEDNDMMRPLRIVP